MSSTVTTYADLHFLLAQLDLSNFTFPGGVRGFTGFTMLVHIFFAELFVGFAIAAPVLQAWGARTGSPRMDRLAHSMVRFNVLTFSSGATFAVLFLVLLVGFYPQVTAALFTHFFYLTAIAMASMILALWGMYSYYYKWDRYSILSKRRHAFLGFTMGAFIWIWMVIMTGIDTFMTTGGGPNATPISEGNVSSFGAALSGIFNPMFVEMVVHRTFANLSWPAFALAAWAAVMYIRSKTEEDRAFYDWSTSVGLTWGTGFLLLQPFSGFFITYAMSSSGSYERLVGEGGGSTPTSQLLYVNLIMVVLLFVLSNVAMYIGAGRHPDNLGRRPIQFFALIAAAAGLCSLFANFDHGTPLFWLRYIALLVMILATLGAFVTYLRGRMRFRYGSPGVAYRVVLLSLGVLAATTALSMGLMKSNSRVPYTVYNQPEFTVEAEQPPSSFGR
ncbi:MAG: cytochrome ubiquinol oxidase subunit I [Actinobacteria bacterium]|nr:cytochrome ubiquinol oxidase subunit I [Actinomycetota bacterium]